MYYYLSKVRKKIYFLSKKIWLDSSYKQNNLKIFSYQESKRWLVNEFNNHVKFKIFYLNLWCFLICVANFQSWPISILFQAKSAVVMNLKIFIKILFILYQLDCIKMSARKLISYKILFTCKTRCLIFVSSPTGTLVSSGMWIPSAPSDHMNRVWLALDPGQADPGLDIPDIIQFQVPWSV